MSRYSLGTYLAGAAVARTADEMSGPALLLLGLAVTGSARTAALLYAALTIAGGCGGPLFGVLLDRSAAPGRVLALALAGYAAGLGAVAVSLGRLPLVAVAVLAAGAGFLAPSLTGGWTSRLPDIVPAPRLARGYSLDVSTYSAAALIGPALAGLVAAAAGAGWAVAVVVALLLLGAPAAGLLPRPDRAGHRAARGSVRSDLRAGFATIAGVRPLLRITVTSVIAYVGVGMLVVACPLLGQRYLGGADRGAVLLSLLAAASLAANAVLARWPARVSPDTLFALATGLAPGLRRPGPGARGGLGDRRCRPGRGGGRTAAHRRVRGPPPRGPGAAAGPGLHHRGQPEDRGRRPRRRAGRSPGGLSGRGAGRGGRHPGRRAGRLRRPRPAREMPGHKGRREIPSFS